MHYTSVLNAGTTFRFSPPQHGFQQVSFIAVTARVAPVGGALPGVEHADYSMVYLATGSHNLVAVTSNTSRMMAASGAASAARTTTLALSNVIVLDAEIYNTIWIRNQTAVTIHVLVQVSFSSAVQP
jgi:hypothetical protein